MMMQIDVTREGDLHITPSDSTEAFVLKTVHRTGRIFLNNEEYTGRGRQPAVTPVPDKVHKERVDAEEPVREEKVEPEVKEAKIDENENLDALPRKTIVERLEAYGVDMDSMPKGTRTTTLLSKLKAIVANLNTESEVETITDEPEVTGIEKPLPSGPTGIEPSEAKEEVQTSPELKTVTLMMKDTIKDMCKVMSACPSLGDNAIKRLFEKYGAKKLSDIKAKDVDALMADGNRLIKDAGGKNA